MSISCRFYHTSLVSGPEEWNSPPTSFCQCTSVAQVKSKLKTHLFTLYYD